MSGTQPVIQQYYPLGASQHGLQNTANFASQQPIRQQGRVIERSAMNNRFTTGVQEAYEDDNDCFRVVRSTRRVLIPCTRNEYRRYKVKVPKQVHEQVPRRVQYTDYETRERKEPYSVKRFETAYREEDQEYTVQVPKKVKKMVKVTKRVPKTVYVDVVTEEPREENIMVAETRKRRVKIPYKKEVLEQKYRTVTETVPVTKYRTEYQTIAKTVYEDNWKTECVPVTNIVHKEIPVYNVVPNEDCGDCEQIDPYPTNYNQVESKVEVLPEPTSNDRVKPHVKTYPPYVETHRGPVSTNPVRAQIESQLLINSYPKPVPAKQAVPNNMKPHIKTNPDNVETHQVPVSTNQVTPQNEPQLLKNSNPRPMPANQVGPKNKAQPVMNAYRASVPTNQIASVKEGQAVMNTSPGAAPTYQVAMQNDPQEVMDFKVTQDPDPTPSMKQSPIRGNNESDEKMQSPGSVPMMEGTPGRDNAHSASDANDTVPQDEQKVETWVETRYSAEYDSNNDGLLDSQEIEDARAEGNLNIQKMVVENPEGDGTDKEDRLPKPALPKRDKKLKKSGGRRRRRKRRK